MDKVIEQTVLKPVTAKKSTIANDLELHQADNMIVIENEKLSELSTFIKEQFSLPATPATSWEEVFKGAFEYAQKDAPIVGSMERFNEWLSRYNAYLSQHWPSSQPVSPTPMAETWEKGIVEAFKKEPVNFMLDNAMRHMTTKQIHCLVHELLLRYPPPPKLIKNRI